MANDTSSVNVTQYSLDLLVKLRDQLGLSSRIFRFPESEFAGVLRGQTVQKRRPSALVAQDVNQGAGQQTSTAQGLANELVSLTISEHKEIRVEAKDLERYFGSQQLMDDHLESAATGLADAIEGSLYGLVPFVGPKTVVTTSNAEDFLVDARTTLVKNRAPAGERHFIADPDLASVFLKSGIYHQAQIAGGDRNVNALVAAGLDPRFGFASVFESQIAATQHDAVSTTLDASADTGDRVGAVQGATAINSASLVIDGLTAGQTILADTVNGATFTIDGDPTVYRVVGGDDTVSGGGALSVTIFPALRRPASNGAVVTFVKRDAVEEAAHVSTLAFHRRGLGMGMITLDTNLPGQEVSSVGDSGYNLRVRRWSNGGTGEAGWTIDVAWGVQVLDGQLVTRVIRAA